MNLFKKILLFSIIIAAISFGVYYFLIASNSKTYIFGNAATQRFLEKVNNLFQGEKISLKTPKSSLVSTSSNSLFKNAEDFIAKTTDNIKEKSDKAIGNVSGNAKSAAIGIVEKNIDNAAQSLREKLGFIGAQTKQDFIVGYSIEPGQIAYFFIMKPKELNNTDYEIDWGDGAKEQSNFGNNDIKVISHAWKTEGEYNIIFKMKTSAGDLDYSSAIMVKK